MEKNNNNCIKDQIPFEVEMTAINGMKYRDTVRWCFCVNCDSDTEARFHDDEGEFS